MKNKISQKIIAGLMLTVFACSNTMMSALALEEMPQLRTTAVSEDTVRLRADVAITSVNDPVSLSLRDSDVKQVLRMFADKAGLNIIFDPSVSGNVTLDLVDVPLNSAFDLVMGVTGLNYVVEDNTLIVSAAGTEVAATKQEITLIPVKYIDAAAMAEFLNKNIFSMKKPGLSSSEIVTVNPMTNELLIFGTKNDVAIARKLVEKFDKKPKSKSIKVSHTTPEQMADLVCNMLIPATSSGGSSTGGAAGISGVMTGGASSSGGSGSDVELGGGEVACTVGGNSSGSISSMPFQTLIVSYFTQQGTIGVLGGSEAQLEMIEEFIAENDKKQPQAYLELSIIELNESGSKALQNTWQYLGKNFTFNYADGTSGNHPAYPIFFSGNNYGYIENQSSGEKYTVQKYTGPSSLTYAINYLVENKKGRVVANPRILITNGQESTIDLTSDYVKTVTSQVLETSLSAATQRTYEIGDDNGIKITVTPFISPDGYVTLNINPDYATIASQVTTLSDAGTQDIQATLLQRRNLELKNVRIKDGETLVIGGMIREDEQKTVKKIPVLGDLPWIGMFFRSTTSSKNKEEMIIMITPKIIVDSDDAIGNENTL
ncbi:type II secretion system protein GspD [bacterium]|nr:type II secretion system protein GspD [bacterium]